MKRLNLSLLVVSVLAGLGAWIIGIILYGILKTILPRCIVIGLVFGLFSAVLGAVLLIFSAASGLYRIDIRTGRYDPSKTVISLLAVSAVVFAAATVLDLIYEFDFGIVPHSPTSYVFAIDDSGSMEQNDPYGKRYSAVPKILGDMPGDFPYMVYVFSSSTQIVREMGPVSSGIPKFESLSSGGTAILETLKQISNDALNGVWDGGERPKVILLTDGYATDLSFGFFFLDRTLRTLKNNHISVSTVGLGNVDSTLMQRIADATGGVFVDVASASELATAMSTAANSYSARDLLSARYSGSTNWLYGIMRILFLAILGVLIGFVGVMAIGVSIRGEEMIVIIGMKALIGGFIMEFGTDVGIPALIMWLIMWLILAIKLAERTSGYSGGASRNGDSRWIQGSVQNENVFGGPFKIG